jgi:hypothetical protein
MSSIAARRANKRACPLQPNGILSRGTHGILAQMGLALAGAALGASPKRGGTLTVVHGVDISNFDVQAAPGYEVV